MDRVTSRSAAPAPVRSRGFLMPEHRSRPFRAALLVFAVLLGSALPAPAREPLVDKVKDSINNGIRYLRDLENGKGNFEHAWAMSRARPGGVTALAVVALLQAGVPPDDPLIQRCLKYLR